GRGGGLLAVVAWPARTRRSRGHNREGEHQLDHQRGRNRHGAEPVFHHWVFSPCVWLLTRPGLDVCLSCTYGFHSPGPSSMVAAAHERLLKVMPVPHRHEYV